MEHRKRRTGKASRYFRRPRSTGIRLPEIEQSDEPTRKVSDRLTRVSQLLARNKDTGSNQSTATIHQTSSSRIRKIVTEHLREYRPPVTTICLPRRIEPLNTQHHVTQLSPCVSKIYLSNMLNTSRTIRDFPQTKERILPLTKKWVSTKEKGLPALYNYRSATRNLTFNTGPGNAKGMCPQSITAFPLISIHGTRRGSSPLKDYIPDSSRQIRIIKESQGNRCQPFTRNILSTNSYMPIVGTASSTTRQYPKATKNRSLIKDNIQSPIETYQQTTRGVRPLGHILPQGIELASMGKNHLQTWIHIPSKVKYTHVTVEHEPKTIHLPPIWDCNPDEFSPSDARPRSTGNYLHTTATVPSYANAQAMSVGNSPPQKPWQSSLANFPPSAEKYCPSSIVQSPKGSLRRTVKETCLVRLQQPSTKRHHHKTTAELKEEYTRLIKMATCEPDPVSNKTHVYSSIPSKVGSGTQKKHGSHGHDSAKSPVKKFSNQNDVGSLHVLPRITSTLANATPIDATEPKKSAIRKPRRPRKPNRSLSNIEQMPSMEKIARWLKDQDEYFANRAYSVTSSDCLDL